MRSPVIQKAERNVSVVFMRFVQLVAFKRFETVEFEGLADFAFDRRRYSEVTFDFFIKPHNRLGGIGMENLRRVNWVRLRSTGSLPAIDFGLDPYLDDLLDGIAPRLLI